MAGPTFTAFAGLCNTLAPERLKNLPTPNEPAVDLSQALNVDIDDSGQLARRAGQTLKHAGAAHSLWSTPDECLFVTGRQLRRLRPDFTSEVLAQGLSEGAAVSYLAVNQRVYWTNGRQTGVVDGLVRSWGITAAEPPFAQILAGGQFAAGQYQAATTLIRRDGQEGGCGLPALFTLQAGQGVRINWPAPDEPGIDEVAVYLSEPDGMVLYQAGVFPAAQGSADITQARLALPLNTQWLDAPPPGQCLALHNGRILIGAGDVVYGTTALGYEYVDLRDFLAIDGAPVTLLLSVAGGLFIGTTKAVYFAAGRRLEDYELVLVVNAPGVPGTGQLVDGFDATANAALAGKPVALFTTGAGVFLGLPDGSVQNLTQARFQFDAAAQGAALFRHDTAQRQYLLFMPR